MIVNKPPHHQPDDKISQHRCGQCIQNEAILQKYKKLVDLLYKKIKQLQKKSTSHLANSDLQKETKIQPPQASHMQFSSSCPTQNSPKYMQEVITSAKQSKQTMSVRTKQSFTDQPVKRYKHSQFQMSEIEKLEKVSIVINGLTEQVMQLKTNFMHIRHCVYAFVKEFNLGDKIYANPIRLNITLALLSIFQFSENQKQEMFNHKKVKMRKKQKNRNKENVFVTIKEI